MRPLSRAVAIALLAGACTSPPPPVSESAEPTAEPTPAATSAASPRPSAGALPQLPADVIGESYRAMQGAKSVRIAITSDGTDRRTSGARVVTVALKQQVVIAVTPAAREQVNTDLLARARQTEIWIGRRIFTRTDAVSETGAVTRQGQWTVADSGSRGAFGWPDASFGRFPPDYTGFTLVGAETRGGKPVYRFTFAGRTEAANPQLAAAHQGQLWIDATTLRWAAYELSVRYDADGSSVTHVVEYTDYDIEIRIVAPF